MAKKQKYYSVVVGKKPGIYTEWYGENGAEAQIKRYKGAIYKSFSSYEEAAAFIAQNGIKETAYEAESSRQPPKTKSKKQSKSNIVGGNGNIIIFTDGGCINNPGPGGYGAVIQNGKQRKELSGGYRLTTNNRMELMACIVALKSLESPSRVSLYSDSKYVVDGISKGWAVRWRLNGWKKADKTAAINPDLWEQLLQLCEQHQVEFIWVKGHAGNLENERCDTLANSIALQGDLPVDEVYESNCCMKSKGLYDFSVK